MINKRKIAYIIICAITIVLITFYGNVEKNITEPQVFVSPFSSVIIVIAGLSLIGLLILIRHIREVKYENI